MQLPRLLSLLLLRFAFLLSSSGKVLSQEAPAFDLVPWSNEDLANPSHSQRTNFCNLHEQAESGTLPRRDALAGVEIHPVLLDYQLNNEGVIDATNAPVAVFLLDELARRAGFTWRDSFGVTSSPPANKTWGDLLEWQVARYDLVGEWYLRTTQRMANGIIFPEGWYDGSLIMVNIQGGEESAFKWNSFLFPFEDSVWLLILATIVITGVWYACLEFLEDVRTGKNNREPFSLARVTYYTFDDFLGYPRTQPKTIEQRIQTVSTGFTALVLVATYTSNLTSFLVVKNQAGVHLETIQDAIRNEQRICVLRGSASEVFFRSKYPLGVDLLRQRESFKESYLALDEGDCDLVLTTVGTWNSFQRNSELNAGCRKQWVGRVVQFNTAGFSLGDSAELCSSILRDVLDLHMIEMKVDGTFDKIWADYLDREETNNCARDDGDDEAGSNQRLDMKNIGGIFCFHMGAMTIAMISSVARLLFKVTSKEGIVRHDHKTQDGNEKDESSHRVSFQESVQMTLRKRKSLKIARNVPFAETPTFTGFSATGSGKTASSFFVDGDEESWMPTSQTAKYKNNADISLERQMGTAKTNLTMAGELQILKQFLVERESQEKAANKAFEEKLQLIQDQLAKLSDEQGKDIDGLAGQPHKEAQRFM